MSAAVILYNTLAFSTQCVVGCVLDIPGRRLKSAAGGDRAIVRFCGCAEAAGMMLVAVGALIPLPLILRVVLFGLGNSIFHVSGGMVTFEKSLLFTNVEIECLFLSQLLDIL